MWQYDLHTLYMGDHELSRLEAGAVVGSIDVIVDNSLHTSRRTTQKH